MNRLLLILMGSLLCTTSFAQERDAQGREIRYNSRTEIDFDGVDVQGQLVKPAGQLLLDRRKANFNPLIRLREHFNDEMKRSVDQIK